MQENLSNSQMPEYATDVALTKPQTWYLEFYGNASEYFKIWIVNVFLTIITLSFYSPWAKVRRLRYFYGNTQLMDDTFDFTAIPARILIGRAIAMVLFVVVSVVSELKPEYALIAWGVISLLFPWLMRSTMRFRARNTKYGNCRFSFSASLGQTYWLYLKCVLITVLSLGLLYPIALYMLKSYQMNHVQIGELKFEMKSTIGNFFGAVWIPKLILIGIMMVAGVGFSILAGAFLNNIDVQSESGQMIVGMLVTVGYIGVLGLYIPLTQAYIFKTTWKDVQIGNNRLNSELDPFKFAWMQLCNYVAVILSLGFLRPWAAIWTYRYKVETMRVELVDNPQDLINLAQNDTHSIGEEMADVFDLDLSL